MPTISPVTTTTSLSVIIYCVTALNEEMEQFPIKISTLESVTEYKFPLRNEVYAYHTT